MVRKRREQAFDVWLHDRGYTYIGPNSLYKLTIPEMVRLQEGWEYREKQKNEGEAAANASAQGMDLQQTPTDEYMGGSNTMNQQQTGQAASAKARAKAANPHRQKHPAPGQQPRGSDIEMLQEINNGPDPNGDGGSR